VRAARPIAAPPSRPDVHAGPRAAAGAPASGALPPDLEVAPSPSDRLADPAPAAASRAREGEARDGGPPPSSAAPAFPDSLRHALDAIESWMSRPSSTEDTPRAPHADRPSAVRSAAPAIPAPERAAEAGLGPAAAPAPAPRLTIGSIEVEVVPAPTPRAAPPAPAPRAYGQPAPARSRASGFAKLVFGSRQR
jgi:hypothetical protein